MKEKYYAPVLEVELFDTVVMGLQDVDSVPDGFLVEEDDPWSN